MYYIQREFSFRIYTSKNYDDSIIFRIILYNFLRFINIYHNKI